VQRTGRLLIVQFLHPTSTTKILQMYQYVQIIETCFEKVGAPGLYFGSGAILSAFSAGRVNSLVIDIGAAGTKITPIVEGYQLQKSSIYTSRGGNLLDEILLSDILNRTGKPIRPWFELYQERCRRKY